MVSGWVTLPPPVDRPAGAVLTVRLLDTTECDAAAVLVAAATEKPTNEDNRVRFELSAPPLDARRDYSVAVHLGLTSVGPPKKREWITTRNYPVRPDGTLLASDDITLTRV
jgi:uncharacterized lipoprotein YbaY